MAEGIFNAAVKKIQETEGCSAISRGLQAYDGSPASLHSIRALKTLWGIDISVHRAKMVGDNDINEADLMLTMTRQHRDTLRRTYPYLGDRIYTLKEYVYPQINPHSSDADIVDPYGASYHVYESCAKEIYNCIKILLDNGVDMS